MKRCLHSSTARIAVLLFASAAASVHSLHAQVHASGPLLTRVPASTRAAALGDAWVTGRDEDVVFYNPAQMISATRGGLAVTYAQFGARGRMGSIASVYAAGPRSLNLGFGIQLADYDTPRETVYPHDPSVLVGKGPRDASSVLFTGAAAVIVKGMRVGVSGKYASDRVAAASALTHDAVLADVGVARNMLGGVVGLAMQNIGHGPEDGNRRVDAPLQASLGWSAAKQAGPLDLRVFGQMNAREQWFGPGAGIDVGYGWIEGYSASVRIGARRTDTDAEQPVALGASFTGDHLTLDYAVGFFDGSRRAHRVTFRWR